MNLAARAPAGTPPLTADDLIGAMKQMIDRAHAHGIKVIGCTLTPFGNVRDTRGRAGRIRCRGRHPRHGHAGDCHGTASGQPIQLFREAGARPQVSRLGGIGGQVVRLVRSVRCPRSTCARRRVPRPEAAGRGDRMSLAGSARADARSAAGVGDRRRSRRFAGAASGPSQTRSKTSLSDTRPETREPAPARFAVAHQQGNVQYRLVQRKLVIHQPVVADVLAMVRGDHDAWSVAG